MFYGWTLLMDGKCSRVYKTDWYNAAINPAARTMFNFTRRDECLAFMMLLEFYEHQLEENGMTVTDKENLRFRFGDLLGHVHRRFVDCFPDKKETYSEDFVRARGFYRDTQAYRNELAARLFSDRENYREVCRFLAMGKAYREIASRTADYHELFKSLLPEPKTEIFERIIEALRTLDESKSALDDLERKLVYLKGLQKFITAIAVNREAVVRYEWLYWHHQTEMAGNDIEKRKQHIGRFSNELEELEKKRLEEVRQERPPAAVFHFGITGGTGRRTPGR